MRPRMASFASATNIFMALVPEFDIVKEVELGSLTRGVERVFAPEQGAGEFRN
jgi:hypothetical protein